MKLLLSKAFYETQDVDGMETLIIFLNYVISNLFKNDFFPFKSHSFAG